MVTQVAFWLSWALILACLLLCLQKQKRLVPFIRKTGPWGVGVPLVSVVLTLALFWAFGIELTVESLVILFGLVFGTATVFYFLFRLSS